MQPATEPTATDGFDPAYFRESRPRWSGAGDAACRHAWQTDPAAAGPGTPQEHLARLGLDLPAFPAAFPWKFYAQRHPEAGSHRWKALEHFVRHGFAADPSLPLHVEATEFLLSLARFYASAVNNDRLAIKAFQLAAACADLPPDAMQHLADSYLREKLWAAARDTYAQVLGTAAASVWTVHNCAQACMELGEWDRAAQIVAGAHATLRAAPAWASIARAVLHRSFDAALETSRSFYAQAQFGAAEHAVHDGVARAMRQLAQIAPPLPGPQARTHLLVIANHDDAVTLRYRVAAKAVLAQAIGVPCTIRSMHEHGDIQNDLRQARAAIFVETPATVDLLTIILAARAAGVPTIYDANGPIVDTDPTPPMESFAGLITPALHDDLRLHAALCRSFAGQCDVGIAAAEGTAATLATLVRRKKSAVVANGVDDTPVAAADVRLPETFLFLRSHRFMRLDDAPGSLGSAILQVLDRDGIGLVLSGYVKLAEGFGAFDDRIVELGPSADPAQYDGALARAALNLAPEIGDRDDGVVQVSWLEAAVHGVATVMSRRVAKRLGLVGQRACLIAETSALAQHIAKALHAGSTATVGATARKRVQAAHRVEPLSRSFAGALHLATDGTIE